MSCYRKNQRPNPGCDTSFENGYWLARLFLNIVSFSPEGLLTSFHPVFFCSQFAVRDMIVKKVDKAVPEGYKRNDRDEASAIFLHVQKYEELAAPLKSKNLPST
ncbi:MAG: hypothetical protein JXD19_05790 [Deltaproteobacteria bacterium]|nr:hypothetical protein [Deltaproteobacteria bacterium]